MAFSTQEKELIKTALSEGKNKNQILGIIADSRKARGFSPTAVTEPRRDILSRARDVPSDIAETGRGIVEAVGRRIEKGKEILEAPQSFPSRVFQTTTNILAGAGEVVGEAVIGAAKTFTTPEQEQAIANSVQKIGEKISKVPEVRQWIKNMNDLKKSNPELARNVISLMEGGEFLLEFAGLKAATVGVKGAGVGIKAGITGAEATVKAGKEAVQAGFKKAGDVVEAGRVRVGGLFGKQQISKDPLSKALSAVTPNTKDLTPTEFKQALRRGQITPGTTTKPSQFILSDELTELATKHQDLLQGDPVRNSGNIISKIQSLDSQVGKHLEKFNTTIWNRNRFAEHLKRSIKELDDITLDVKRVETAKKKLVKAFTDSLPENATLEDLWIARKNFDQLIESQGAFKGSPTLTKDMKKALRDAVQDFIEVTTGDDVYGNFMKEMRGLFRLRENVFVKATKEKGLTGIQLWTKQNPIKAKAARWIIPFGLGAFTF